MEIYVYGQIPILIYLTFLKLAQLSPHTTKERRKGCIDHVIEKKGLDDKYDCSTGLAEGIFEQVMNEKLKRDVGFGAMDVM